MYLLFLNKENQFKEVDEKMKVGIKIIIIIIVEKMKEVLLKNNRWGAKKNLL
jgi:hypothetical protein